MIQLNHSQRSLLRILGDGNCRSDNELGQALGVTRSAVWKHINQLVDLGVPINHLPHQGYQLPNPLILLDQQQLTDALQKNGFTHSCTMHLFTSIDSTNRYLKDLPPGGSIDVCCAELQTQGRGRFGRNWHSPFGENIYCSSRWNLGSDLSQLSGLGLITSLAVLATVNEFSPSADIQIKWPNDILWRGKKLCGSLIEIVAGSHSNTPVIIGIGLNVNVDTSLHALPDKPWCSLYEISQQRYDRNLIIAQLIVNLERYIHQFIHHGLQAFMDEWNQYDYLAGKYLTVTQSLATISGTALGITQEGLLILKDDQGKIHHLSSGDTSLHQGQVL